MYIPGQLVKFYQGFIAMGKNHMLVNSLPESIMISFLSQQLVSNESFIEQIGDEIAPPPISLMQRDLNETYSVQTPYAAIAMFNVLYLKQSFNELNKKLLAGAKQAARETERYVQQKANLFAEVSVDLTMPTPKINVFMYEELYAEAVKRFGKEEISR